MLDLTNLIRRECGRLLMRWARTRHVLVTSYDPKTNSIKGTFQPEGHMSGWIPIQTQAASANGVSVQIGPAIGDLAVVSYVEGDPEASFVIGFKHNDVDRAPGSPSGTVIIKHNQSGVTLTISGSGHTLTAPGQTIALSGATITTNGNHTLTGGGNLA